MKLDIQMFADGDALVGNAEEVQVMAYDEAYYLDLGDSTTPDIELMNVGVTKLEEGSNPIEQSVQYIGDKSKTNKVTGYDNTWDLESDLIHNNKVIDALYDVFRSRKTGTQAQFDFYIVELWNATETANTFVARKVTVTAIIESKVPTPGEAITFSGSLKGVGDFKYGTFNTSTKAFVENA